MEYFNKAVGQTLQYPEAKLIFARYYNIKGANKADDGLLEEALENFNKAVELNPHYAVAFFNRATIKADLGDFDGAKEDFHRAKGIDLEFKDLPIPLYKDSLLDEISNDYINYY